MPNGGPTPACVLCNWFTLHNRRCNQHQFNVGNTAARLICKDFSIISASTPDANTDIVADGDDSDTEFDLEWRGMIKITNELLDRQKGNHNWFTELADSDCIPFGANHTLTNLLDGLLQPMLLYFWIEVSYQDTENRYHDFDLFPLAYIRDYTAWSEEAVFALIREFRQTDYRIHRKLRYTVS